MNFLKVYKNSLIIILILFLSLVFRLYLTSLAFHDDILSNVGWGEWIYNNGPKGFYENTTWLYSWPTQPPLINLIYGNESANYRQIQFVLSSLGVFIAQHHLGANHLIWFFDFNKWFSSTKYLETNYPIGLLISEKLYAILADLGLGLVIYLIAKQMKLKRPAIWASLYLASPFSWYLSSLWGQYDQLGYLCLLMAFLSVLNKRTILISPILFVVSVAVKPTSLIFVPLFGLCYFKQRPGWLKIVISTLLCLLIVIWQISLFSNVNFIEYINTVLVPKIFFKSEFRVSTNAFNFWRILIGPQALNQNTLFIGIPAKIWGWLAFAGIYGYIWVKLKRVNLYNLVVGMFLVGAGGWLFLTNMLDRYFFAGVMSLFFLSMFKRSLLKYFLMIALIYWINLFNLWWFPNWLWPLKSLLLWNDGLFSRLLSLANVVIFIRVFWEINRQIKEKGQNGLGQ